MIKRVMVSNITDDKILSREITTKEADKHLGLGKLQSQIVTE